MQPEIPQIVTTFEDSHEHNSSSQPASPGLSAPIASPTSRRPSEAATLVPASEHLLTASDNKLHPYHIETAARSRSSSVGDSSVMSGETVRPDTADHLLQPDHEPFSDHDYTSYTSSIESVEALKPDPGTENDFKRDNNCFAFTPGHMNKFLNPKNLDAFRAVGGIRGLERGLQTDLRSGLSMDEGKITTSVSFEEATSINHLKSSSPRRRDFGNEGSSGSGGGDGGSADPGSYSDRKRIFATNALPDKKAKSVFVLMWEQYKDKVLLLLTGAAIISLALGLYETLGVKQQPGDPPSVDWIEGVAICVAILIVVFVGSLNDYQKERQFVKLNKKKEDRVVKAIRSGKSMELPVHEILVGDVLHVEPGDMIPADGIFIQGHNLKCDESSATGESDQMKKTGGEEVYKQIESGNSNPKLDPFLISGSKVLEGMGTYLVTSTGVNSSFGKLMMSLREDAEGTPLQQKLSTLADYIAYLGGGAATLLFIVLFIRFLVQLPGDTRTGPQKGEAFMDILIVCITLIVVAVPEGLPLAVTLALAFATTRMMKANNLVRLLRACETMGNATTVCSDKTGTLTENKMTVVAGTVSLETEFSTNPEENKNIREVLSRFSKAAKKLFLMSITMNTTAFEGESEGKKTFIGSKTETAMLQFATDFLGMDSISSERSHMKVTQMIPFDSGRKCMGVVVQLPEGGYRLLVKGASEILLEKATRRIASVEEDNLSETELTKEEREQLSNTITTYAERSLRTIGMLYKDYQQWPPVGAKRLEDDDKQADFNDVFNEMVFIGIVGIQDPLREGVKDAVKKCQEAGVVVRMVTGDNMTTARAIAIDCGILVDGENMEVMEGPKFRTLGDNELHAIVPRLRVLARSSPEDKRILVRKLKELGETVAVTGDGTNDGPALKMADIGFSMGISGTEVAKEASSIILMDDNFASIITAIMWGRAVNDAVRKFLQFQLTVNITAVALTFVSAVSSSSNSSVLTAVQLLWVNLIMDTFAALALATDPPTPEILNRKPSPKSAPLVSLNMWKMIIGQAVFQLVVTFVMNFAGKKIYPSYSDEIRATIVFNTFVWMQIFNEFNNRRLDNKFNVFEGMFKNYFFLGINAIMIGGQVLIIFVGGRAFSIKPLNGDQWAICLVAAVLCLPWAILLRCIPDSWVGKVADWGTKVFGPPVEAVARFWHSLKRVVFRRKKSELGDSSVDEESAPGTPQGS